MKKSSEQPEQQQDSLQSEDVGKDQHQTTPPRHQQSVKSQSPKTSSSVSESNPVLHNLLTSPTKMTAQQAYVTSNKDPCSSKQANQSSSSQLMQGEKRRSEGVSEQHSESKLFKQPDVPKEKQKTKEESEKEKAKE